MIKRLILKNWKSHKDSVFDFAEGTNVLMGIMGSGKSSIVEAITFAMFGTFPSVSQRKIKMEDVVMRGETNAFVELIFTLNEKEYTVRRLIEKGRTTTSELFDGETLIESPQSSKVTETIESIIKMDYDLFIRAIYAEQNSIDYFLTIPRGQRMKKIDSLLKLDKFETARANSNFLLNKIKDEKKTKMILLERLGADESIKSFDRLKQETRLLREKISEFEIQNEIVIKEIEITRKEISSLESQEIKIIEIEKNAVALKTSIEELEKRSREISSLIQSQLILTDSKKLNEEYSKIQEKLLTIENEMKKKESELSTLNARLDMQKSLDKEIEMRLSERDTIFSEIGRLGSIEEIRNSIIEKSKEQDEKKRILFTAKSEIEHEKSHIKNLNIEGCPVCERDIGEDLFKKIKIKKESKILELENIITSSQDSVKKLSEEMNDLDIKRMHLESMTQKYSLFYEDEKKQFDIRRAIIDLSEKIPEAESSLHSYRNEYERFRKESKLLETQLAEIKVVEEREREINIIRHRLEKLYENKKLLELQSKEILFDPSMLKILRNRLEKSTSQKATIESQLSSERRFLQEKQERITSIESQKRALENLTDEITKLESISKQLKLFSESLEVTQLRLRQEFVKTVNMVMSEIWSQFYPYQDYTDIRLAVDEGDYSLELLAKNWLNVEGVASGGERSSAALVLRIALALVLAPNLRWLILDEPTHNLDSNAIELLSTILRYKISEFVDQVFLITHEPRLEDAVSGYLYRLDRPENKRSPTAIQKIDTMKD